MSAWRWGHSATSPQFPAAASGVAVGGDPVALVLALEAADIEALLGFGLQERAEHALHQKLLEMVLINGKAITDTLTDALRDWMVRPG